MVKSQQMRWSKRGAHLALQVRAEVMKEDLRERLSYQPPVFKSPLDWMFKPTHATAPQSRRPQFI
jgi:hypothetical protein